MLPLVALTSSYPLPAVGFATRQRRSFGGLRPGAKKIAATSSAAACAASQLFTRASFLRGRVAGGVVEADLLGDQLTKLLVTAPNRYAR